MQEVGVRTTLFPFLCALACRGALAADPAPGDILVKTNPPDARILLDGQDTGVLSPGLIPKVPAGSHEIRAVSACATAAATLQVREAMVERIELDLVNAPATLVIGSVPPGAVARVDGTEVGKTPLVAVPVTCGSHTVALSLDGYRTFTATVSTDPLAPVEVSGVLAVRRVGRLQVRAHPEEAEILVDGVVVGAGRVDLPVDSGAHVVTLRLDGYERQDRSITIQADASATVEARLSAEKEPFVSRIRWANLGVDATLTAMTLGLAIAARSDWQRSEASYDVYTSLGYGDDPELYYDTQVIAPLRAARILGGIAGGVGVLAVGGFVFLPVVGPASP